MSLQSLSDSDLLSHIQKLVRQEREVTLLVLLHLNEIERRRLHLKLGCSSLFEYCTSTLGYSSSSAYRRIQTARCVARFPVLYDLLKRNDVNLSTVSMVSRILTDENHEAILSRISGKSQRDVEAILAELQPGALPRDRVRTLVVGAPASRAGELCALNATTAAPSAPGARAAETSNGRSQMTPVGGLHDRDERPDVPAPAPAPSGACEKDAYCRSGSKHFFHKQTRDVETRVVLQFSVHPEFITKLDKVRSLAWHRLPANASLENVFGLLMDNWLEREDPSRRVARREQRVERKEPTRRDVEKGRARPAPNPGLGGRPRHIPASIRDDVFQRDGGRCAFVGIDGRRCDSTQALQVDHVTPVTRGGSGTPGNLRLLCAYHNRLEAERLLGPAAGRRRVPTARTRGLELNC